MAYGSGMIDRGDRDPLARVHVVLARPSEPRNIGAACRAIANFGMTRLSIVTDRPVDYDAARPLAVGATDVLEAARVASSLSEVTAGCSLVAGITRRLGQKRKHVSYTPWDFAERFVADARGRARGDVAIVFGNEQAGLSDEELEQCHLAVSIPTSPACPSLNLSHAVAVIAHELYRAARAGSLPAPDALNADEIEQTAQQIVDSLKMLGYHWQEGPQGMRSFMRDVIARAGLSSPEAHRFKELFTKLAGMHGRRNEF